MGRSPIGGRAGGRSAYHRSFDRGAVSSGLSKELLMLFACMAEQRSQNASAAASMGAYSSSSSSTSSSSSSGRRKTRSSGGDRGSGSSLYDVVRITRLSAKIDETPTKIDEKSPSVLKYRTPRFRASVTVLIPPIPDKDSWQIGWIQACTDMIFINTYGSYGVSSWEFPELKTGGYAMISDSDGRNYPWYGSRTEVEKITGPTYEERSVNLSMTDNFYPHITWTVPLRSHKEPALTHVRRDQGFYTWLVAKNLVTGKHYILQTIRWSMHLEISVDPSKPLGHRAQLVGDGIQRQPEVFQNYNVPIPECALLPPNANSAQTLIWYPSIGVPVVIVPPKSTEREQ